MDLWAGAPVQQSLSTTNSKRSYSGISKNSVNNEQTSQIAYWGSFYNLPQN
jgi:hypothetical protein